jgi:hypothetical protein
MGPMEPMSRKCRINHLSHTSYLSPIGPITAASPISGTKHILAPCPNPRPVPEPRPTKGLVWLPNFCTNLLGNETRLSDFG